MIESNYYDTEKEIENLYSCRELLRELVQAIDSKWKKTMPPKELIEPLARAKEILEGKNNG